MDSLLCIGQWGNMDLEQTVPGKYAKEASLAKVYATVAANRACCDAMQILGGYGYTQEFPLERFYRDVRVTTIYFGTSEIQRLIIVRELMQ